MPHQGRKSNDRKSNDRKPNGQRSNGQVVTCNADALEQCVTRLCDASFFGDLRFAERCTWTPRTLSAASLFWIWSDESTLADRFSAARRITKSVWNDQDKLSSAYQPFMRMQRRWSALLIFALTLGYRRMMTRELDAPLRNRKWAEFAIDGSRFELPRTVSNERAFSPKPDNGKRKRRVCEGRFANEAAEKKSNSPQIWVTLLWHLNSGLPWAWRRGESGSSERRHLLEMIDELPSRSLLTADAGFVGYEVWKAILDAGHDLLVRVGGNTTLLQRLGYAKESGNTVYLWPDKAASAARPPLVLRLVLLKRRGKTVYFVTSISSRKLMSDQELLRIARRRWGVEVFYRSWKQTFDKRKLRSRNSSHALIELDWSLIGLWGICLFAQIENPEMPSRKLSVAKVLRAVRRPMRAPSLPPERGESLFELLSRARVDDYRRRKSKASRDYPLKKKPDKISPPILRIATARQRIQARGYMILLKSAA